MQRFHKRKLNIISNSTFSFSVSVVLTLWPRAEGVGLGQAGLLRPLAGQRRLVHDLLLQPGAPLLLQLLLDFVDLFSKEVIVLVLKGGKGEQ